MLGQWTARVATLAACAVLIAPQGALAICAPPAVAGGPPAGTIVECTGATFNQNALAMNGYGEGTQNGLTINVEPGASVGATNNGFALQNGNTINVLSGASVSATVIGIAVQGGNVINNFGTVTSVKSGGAGIAANGSVVVNNFGTVGASVLLDGTGIFINGGNSVIMNAGAVQMLSGSLLGNGVHVLNGVAMVNNSGTVLAPTGFFFEGGTGILFNSGTVTGIAGTAIKFTGSADVLILAPTSVIKGNVLAGAGDTLALGGTGTGTFDVSLLGTQYQGFTAFNVVGPATWNLVGVGNQGWNVLGGTLGGTATIGGLNVFAGGTVAPGTTSFGTLSVVGNVLFQPGSFYAVKVNPAGANDKIMTAGAAVLKGGAVQALAGSGVYAPKTVYTILTANAGVSGVFDGVTSSLAFLFPTLTYDSNNVFLTLTQKTSLASAAFTHNQVRIASALDKFPVLDPVLLAVLNQTPAGARQAFDALSGEVHGATQSVLVEEAHYVRQAILGRLRTLSYGEATGSLSGLALGGPALSYAALDNARYMADAPAIVPPPRMDIVSWAQGYGAWGRLDSDFNAATVNRRIGGFAAGLDTGGFSIGPFTLTRLGLAGGYSRSDLDLKARASAAGIESTHVGAYWASNLWGFSFRSGAALALHSIDTSRSIAFPGFNDTASARYDGYTAQSFSEVGYGFNLWNVALEPFAGLTSVRVKTDNFRELGGPAALLGTSETTNVTYASLGLRLAHKMPLANGMWLTARGTFAWQHAIGEVTADRLLVFQSNAIAFEVAGVPIARDAALVEAGLDLAIMPNATLGVAYSGQLARDARDHSVKGTLAVRF